MEKESELAQKRANAVVTDNKNRFIKFFIYILIILLQSLIFFRPL